jgi:DNA-binding CsgD family transcriptional regulator/GAF domain-containing protein
MDSRRLSGLIRDLYAAALEPDNRCLIAPKFAAAFDAASCLLLDCETSTGNLSVISSTSNIDDDMLLDYAAQFRLPMKRSYAGVEVSSEPDWIRSKIFADGMMRIDLHHHIGAVFEAGAGRVGLVGVHRPSGAPAFDSEALGIMDLLLPHLRQTISFAARFEAEALGKRIGMEALSSLAIGAILVSQDCSVRLMNGAAERILREKSGVLVRHGRLSLAKASLDTQLRAAIAAAARSSHGIVECPGTVIAIQELDQRSTISLTVTPLQPDANAGGSPEPLAVVFLAGQEAPPLPLPPLLRKAYGLTSAEARVLLAVVSGARLADHAEENGVRLETVRSQLKQIFWKTGCSRQSDLVRLVLNNPIIQLAEAGLR